MDSSLSLSHTSLLEQRGLHAQPGCRTVISSRACRTHWTLQYVRTIPQLAPPAALSTEPGSTATADPDTGEDTVSPLYPMEFFFPSKLLFSSFRLHSFLSNSPVLGGTELSSWSLIQSLPPPHHSVGECPRMFGFRFNL